MELLKEGPLTFACKSSWQDWQAWYIFSLSFSGREIFQMIYFVFDWPEYEVNNIENLLDKCDSRVFTLQPLSGYLADNIPTS